MCSESDVPQASDPRPDPSPAPDAAPASTKRGHQGEGKRDERLVRHFKIDEQLSRDDRAAYEALMLDPRQTVDSLQAWLRERGYDISRGAVQRHRRHFEKDVKEIRKTAKVACQFAALARAQGGAGSLADAGQFRFEQMFLERLFGMKGDERLSGKEWNEFGKAMTALLENRQKYETLRAEWEAKAKRATEMLRQASDEGWSRMDAVQRMEEILGA